MIPVLLLHGEGPILDLAIKAGVAIPLIFTVLAWVTWWIGRGRHLTSRPAGVVLRAGLALVAFGLIGLLAVVLGLALNFAVASDAVARWPGSMGVR